VEFNSNGLLKNSAHVSAICGQEGEVAFNFGFHGEMNELVDAI
jgi:hypothetical protein